MRALYRRLRTIEASLREGMTASEIAGLEGDVESLDCAIMNLGVPMKHSDLYFTLKSHLNLVRTRAGLRRAELRPPTTRVHTLR